MPLGPTLHPPPVAGGASSEALTSFVSVASSVFAVALLSVASVPTELAAASFPAWEFPLFAHVGTPNLGKTTN